MFSKRFCHLFPNGNSLGDVHSYCCNPEQKEFFDVEIALDEKFTKYNQNPDNKDKIHVYHEAAYDAYVTGYCFLKMFCKAVEEEDKAFRNRVHIHRCNFFFRHDAEDELCYAVKLLFNSC